MRPIAKKIIPPHSFRRKVVKKILVALGLKSPVLLTYYNTWANQQYAHPTLKALPKTLEQGPLISIVVPAYNTPQRYLDDLIYSIISQSYQNWELILANASTTDEARLRVSQTEGHDNRIKSIDIENNGISENTNAGIAEAKGEYIAFCDHDDVLEPTALQDVAQAIIEQNADVIYTDEDKISDNGEVYFDPHFKPDWSPDLMTHVNYMNHLSVVRKSLLNRAGDLNPDRDGAQDYDLMLRIVDLNPKIVHIPKVLYHWRAAQNSTATDFSSKKHITDAAKAALEDHFARIGTKVTVKPKAAQPGFYELEFNKPTKLTLIVTPFCSVALLRLYIGLLLKKSGDEHTRVQLVIPEGCQPAVVPENVSLTTLPSDDEFMKRAIEASTHTYIVIVNQIAIPQDRNWLAKLCSPLQLTHLAAAAPLLVRDGVVIEDCGIINGVDGNSSMLFRGHAAFNNQTFFGNTNWVRNVDALTGGIIAVRKSELQSFLNTVKLLQTPKDMLRAYSEQSAVNKKYNLLYTETILDNLSIRLSQNKESGRPSYFNENLFVSGLDFEPYTPEQAALNILLHYVDHQENPA